MKYIIISFLLFASCTREVEEAPEIEPEASLNITKTEVGYNIYSNKGLLILEFTKRNCDSTELKLLDDIYSTAKEFYNKKGYEEEIPKFEGTKNI